MTPALDYEEVKDFFFHKLESDRFGKGRMESALFHTAQFIFDRGLGEREKLLEEIALLRSIVDRMAVNNEHK